MAVNIKTYLGIISLIILVVVFGYLLFYYTKQNSENQVCFKKNCFAVELATTATEQEKGLMNRTELDKNKGMLFIFNTVGIYPFWMKNTLIFLDIIWFDKDGKIVYIKENAEPCKTLICPIINPLVKAKYVLEIDGGLVQKLNIKTGDMASFKISN